MPPPSAKRSRKHAYHHGDLRHALSQAAWVLVRRDGLAALTLREVAREVGVTHAAPYHHFASRDALLDALSDEAFEALDREILRATREVSEPLERLFVLGRAYIDHGRAHPEQLEVMFRRKSVTDFERAPGGGGERVFNHLLEAVQACQAARLAPEGDSYALALEAWSLVHGFSKLWIEGPLAALPPYRERFEQLRDESLRRFGAAWHALAQGQTAPTPKG